MDEESIKDIVDGHNQYAIELYLKMVEAGSENVFFSPYSIYQALALAYEGALEQTKDEMQKVLHFPDHQGFDAMFTTINDLILQSKDIIELRNANALWLQEDFPFLEPYLQRVKNLSGKVLNLDFYNNSENSRNIINTIVAKETNQHIKEILPPNSIHKLIQLVITNAIYFKGKWKYQFIKKFTRKREFTISSGDMISTPMMFKGSISKGLLLKYMKSDELEILELPYRGDQLSMLILLPTNDISSLESSISFEKYMEWKNNLKSTRFGKIFIPRFKFDTNYQMNVTLRSLGMINAFSGKKANFRAMADISKEDNLWIDNIFHKAFVKVDEMGTEAAAATAIGIRARSARTRESLPIFNANHPFLFTIQENTHGTILFMGKVMDPSQNQDDDEYNDENTFLTDIVNKDSYII